jgi:3-oxoacyl-[acyl-carrier protein] reductase
MMRKVYLVVGASSGIGLELVKLITTDETNEVIALARNIENVEELKNIKNIQTKNFDLSSSNLKDTLGEILKDFPRIDYLVNNAGLLVNKPFLELTKEDIYSSYQVNILSQFEVIQTVLPKMFEFGGHVVNISSMGAFQGSVKFSGLSSYSSSKASLTNLTEMLAEEFKESKVKFNCLCLGAAQTKMLEKAFPGYEAPVSAEIMSEYIYDFTKNAFKWINGKIIPVSLSTP